MLIELVQGDARELFADWAPDVLIVDPPYARHVHESATSCGTPGAKSSQAASGASHRDLGFAHLSEDLRGFVSNLAARTRRWSILFSDTESVGEWKASLESAGAKYIRAVPWVRWSAPILSGDRPPQGHEMILLAWGSQVGKKSWNGPGNLTHFAHKCMRGKEKHKAQKPLDLILDLVTFFSNEGETVCDPCSGSGTTALACGLLERNFRGTELDPDWHRRAMDRLKGVSPEYSIGPLHLYDDQSRFERYQVAAKIRQTEIARMRENTARIVANREKREEAELSANDLLDEPEGRESL